MKKLVSLLLMLVFVFSLSCAMAEGKKHVENLIVGTTAANNTFNMTTQSDAFGRMNYNGLTQGNYVYRDANGDLQPYFFTSYEISEDGKVLDFTWHKGAIWHDGQPVTDEDIIFTFEFQRDVKKVGGLSNLVSVEITGENAARLTFSQPDVYYYLNTSCMNTACIYAKHIWEGIEDPTTPARTLPLAAARTSWWATMWIPRPLTMRPCRRTRSSAKSPWTR